MHALAITGDRRQELPLSLAALPPGVREKAPYLPTAWTVTATSTNPLAYEEMSSTGVEPRSIRRGRFLSVDSGIDEEAAMYEPQRWNRYTYALNSPLKYVDRDGKNAAVAVGGGIIVIGGIVLIHEWEMATNPHYRKAMTDIGSSIWTTLMSKQTGRQGDTGLEGLSVDQVQKLLDQAQGADKLRYIKQLKWLKDRNRGKSRGGGREPKKPKGGGGGEGAGPNKMEFFSDIGSLDADSDESSAAVGSGTPQFFAGQSLSVDFLLERMRTLDSFWQWFDMQDPNKK